MFRVCVVGLGKIGLPLAAQYASKGCRVAGCDINEAVVMAVNRGRSPVEEPGLQEKLERAVEQGLLEATMDAPGAVRDSDVIVVIVPLIVDDQKHIDYTTVDAATRSVAKGLQRGSLVIYETTLPVGTTRNRLGPMLAEGASLCQGKDFSLAFSPERVYSGRIFADLNKYPKIVGGIDIASLNRAVEFYSQVLDAEVIKMPDTDTAEFVKLIETTYRNVNIALASEFAKFAAEWNIDVIEAIQAANTQPFSHIHRPGVGVGGHCIPVYPYFLINNSNGNMELARLAQCINDGMSQYAVELLRQKLGDLRNKTVLILGLAYRENVKETAFTTAKLLIDVLEERGAKVLVHDPLFSREEIESFRAPSADLSEHLSVDAIIVHSYHDQYKNLDFSIFKGSRVVLDGRNILDRECRKHIESLGMDYVGIGR